MHSVKEALISNTVDALDSEAVASEAFITPQKNSSNKARDLENHSSAVSRQSSTASFSSSPSRIIDSGTLFSRDVPNIYFTSLMTRVDELSSEKHINMQLVEFIEALARIADKANFEPQIRAQNTLRQSLKRRQTQLLLEKSPAMAAMLQKQKQRRQRMSLKTQHLEKRKQR